MMMALEVRPFRRGVDEETYARIFNSTFLDYDDIRSITPQEVRTLEDAPSFNLDGVLIAEWNGQIAGMVQALVDKFREEKKGFIQSLAVLPEFRRKGIAKRLVSEAVSSLKCKGMKLVDTWAQTDRPACVHIYETAGFKPVRASSLMKADLAEVPTEEVNEEVNLREAQLESDEDIGLINKLDNEAFREHFNFRPITIEETKYLVSEMPWWKHQKAWFATLEKQPIGYVITGIDVGLNEEKKVNYGWILNIGVLKPLRRRKIGSTLMVQAMQNLKTQGMTGALLYVDDQNPTRAIKLYEKVGFKVYHKSTIYELQLA
jgi:mycothiol synthase